MAQKQFQDHDRTLHLPILLPIAGPVSEGIPVAAGQGGIYWILWGGGLRDSGPPRPGAGDRPSAGISRLVWRVASPPGAGAGYPSRWMRHGPAVPLVRDRAAGPGAPCVLPGCRWTRPVYVQSGLTQRGGEQMRLHVDGKERRDG